MLSTIAITVRFCSTCQGDVAFEQPECIDDHGTDCPEWVCVQCGDALLLGFALVEPAPLVAARHVA
jgi:hypothetical protein